MIKGEVEPEKFSGIEGGESDPIAWKGLSFYAESS